VARRAFLERALCGVQRALVITEGLLPYLEERDVIALGHDLAARAEISGWILDVHSPGVLRIAQRATDKHLAEGSRMRFAPSAGVGFFRQLGFEPVEVSSLARAAARMRRMSLLMSLSTWLPEPKPDNLGLRPWAAVAWLARAKQTVRASRPRPKSH
jgi:O-methyltransferase involved in polyketide biosynthesis